MAGRGEASKIRGSFQQSIQNTEAVAGKNREDAQSAFLEAVVRDQCLPENAFVMVEELDAAVGGAAGAGAQLFELVEHFALGEVEGSGKSGIEVAERFADAREIAAEVALSERHLARKGTRNRLEFEFMAQVLAATENVANGERVLE